MNEIIYYFINYFLGTTFVKKISKKESDSVELFDYFLLILISFKVSKIKSIFFDYFP